MRTGIALTPNQRTSLQRADHCHDISHFASEVWILGAKETTSMVGLMVEEPNTLLFKCLFLPKKIVDCFQVGDEWHEVSRELRATMSHPMTPTLVRLIWETPKSLLVLSLSRKKKMCLKKIEVYSVGYWSLFQQVFS